MIFDGVRAALEQRQCSSSAVTGNNKERVGTDSNESVVAMREG